MIVPFNPTKQWGLEIVILVNDLTEKQDGPPTLIPLWEGKDSSKVFCQGFLHISQGHKYLKRGPFLFWVTWLALLPFHIFTSVLVPWSCLRLLPACHFPTDFLEIPCLSWSFFPLCSSECVPSSYNPINIGLSLSLNYQCLPRMDLNLLFSY